MTSFTSSRRGSTIFDGDGDSTLVCFAGVKGVSCFSSVAPAFAGAGESSCVGIKSSYAVSGFEALNSILGSTSSVNDFTAADAD